MNKMATAQNENRTMYTTEEMVAYVENIVGIANNSNEEKLEFFERKHAEAIRKLFTNELTQETYNKRYHMFIDCINCYRNKLGLIDYETKMNNTSILDGGNLVMDGGDPNEELMINPDLFEYAGTKDFYKIPIIVRAASK
jgi:hypothetical protein